MHSSTTTCILLWQNMLNKLFCMLQKFAPARFSVRVPTELKDFPIK